MNSKNVLWLACATFIISSHSFAQPMWGQYAKNPQHTALVTQGVQAMRQILWHTTMDLNPAPDAIHYGTPLISQAGTVVVTVRTGATGSDDTFRIEGHSLGTGTLLWTEATDYIDPPHGWIPSCGSAIDSTNRLYTPGSGGTVLMRANADSPASAVTRQCFYGMPTYEGKNKAAYDSYVQISTPITVDKNGNIYFGFRVDSAFTAAKGNTAGLASGIARITAAGAAEWISADAASGDKGDEVAINCTPALSNDGRYLYIAVKGQGNGNTANPKLLRLSTSTLAVASRVALVGPRSLSGAATAADILDDGTATPMVGLDGDVYYGIWFTNTYRGFMLHYSGDLSSARTPGAFGWDDTASMVPAYAVPSYHGRSSYLILTKYNNYISPGDGMNRVAVLDPNATEVYTDTPSGQSYITMKEVISVLGVTSNGQGQGVREWCINTAAIDLIGKAAIINCEDGTAYRWDFTTNSLTESVNLEPPTSEAYTPTIVSNDGVAFAVNNATLFAMWDAVKPSTVSLDSATFTGGDSMMGTVALSDFATGPGAVIYLQSSDPSLRVPPAIHILPGKNSARFQVTTSTVGGDRAVAITASRYGFSVQSQSITLTPSSLFTIVLNHNPLYGNQTGTGSVVLSGAAPTSGRTATLSSDLSSITFPSKTVTIPGGAYSGPFNYKATPVSATIAGHVRATYPDGSYVESPITNHAPVLAGISLSPSEVVGGKTTELWLTTKFASPSPGVKVVMSYSAHTNGLGYIWVSSSNQAKGPVSSTAVASSVVEWISATFEGVTKKAAITLSPPGSLKSFTVDSSQVVMTHDVTGTVTLASPAVGNIVMGGNTSDGDIVFESYPAAAKGKTQGQCKLRTMVLPTNQPHNTIISVYFNGTTLYRTVTVNPILVQSVVVSPSTLHSGGTGTCTVTLKAPAGSYPLPLNLSASSNMITIPTVVYAAAGKSTATFTVKAASSVSGNNQVQIYVTLCGVKTKATVNVDH